MTTADYERFRFSAWIEFLRGGTLASTFLPVIEDKRQKWTLLEKGEYDLMTAMQLLERGNVILLDSVLAGDASRLSIKHKLPMADAIIYATALAHAAEV